jgi:hypothetical protein
LCEQLRYNFLLNSQHAWPGSDPDSATSSLLLISTDTTVCSSGYKMNDKWMLLVILTSESSHS